MSSQDLASTQRRLPDLGHLRVEPLTEEGRLDSETGAALILDDGGHIPPLGAVIGVAAATQARPTQTTISTIARTGSMRLKLQPKDCRLTSTSTRKTNQFFAIN